jgi:Rnl2 family RNA ligase
MEFTKYSSIENAYRERFIEHCLQLGVTDWVALEKVHGANFSFICDDKMQVTPAKRTGILEIDVNGNYDFYGCNDVVAQYVEKVKQIAHIVGGPVQVFGELYGQGVQSGTDYGAKDFIAFDIMLECGSFLSWPSVIELCSTADISTVPLIAVGKLEDLLKISPEFTSHLCNDKAEGIVIKPIGADGIEGYYLPNGSRAIIKNKSVLFSEKSKHKVKIEVVLSEEGKEVFEDICTYINDNRLRSVLSKIGAVTQKDFGMIAGKLTEDAKIEFERDGYVIEKAQWKEISKQVNKEASSVVRSVWLNILDGNF